MTTVPTMAAAGSKPCVAGGAVQPTSWESLAILRFFLAVIVLAGHLTWLSSRHIAWAGVLDAFGGKAAVVGFLLVSGYSIGSSLQRSHRNFYRRRLLRIYPLYFFAIVYSIAIERVTGGQVRVPGNVFHSGSWITDLGNLALVQTFLVKPISFDGPVWSLAVEVFYYVLAPLFARFPRKYLLGLVAVSAVCALLPNRPQWGVLYLIPSKLNALRYLWCWLLGFMLWQDRCAGLPETRGVRLEPPLPAARFSLTVTTLSMIALGVVLVVFGRDTREAGSVVTYLLSVTVILVAPSLSFPRTMRRAADYLGDLSYPLYLYHLPTFLLAYAFLGVRSPALLVVCAVLVTAVALHFVDGFLKTRYFTPWVLGRARRTRVAAGVAAPEAAGVG